MGYSNPAKCDNTSFPLPIARYPISLVSTTPVSYLPRELLKALVNKFPEASFNRTSGQWEVSCHHRSHLATIDFGFEDTLIHVPLRSFILEFKGVCFLGVTETGKNNPALLGSNFLGSAYIVFDQDQKSLYMAQFQDCGSNIVNYSPSAVSEPGECSPSRTPSATCTSTASSSGSSSTSNHWPTLTLTTRSTRSTHTTSTAHLTRSTRSATTITTSHSHTSSRSSSRSLSRSSQSASTSTSTSTSTSESFNPSSTVTSLSFTGTLSSSSRRPPSTSSGARTTSTWGPFPLTNSSSLSFSPTPSPSSSPSAQEHTVTVANGTTTVFEPPVTVSVPVTVYVNSTAPTATGAAVRRMQFRRALFE
ncbi:aspartic peptidase domain-containing protein [Camillea tinctor]|nr:aspartic peptidase domain-containing protein [Camillea tinctor]